MAKDVLALYDKLEEAEAAVDELVHNGFDRESIRLDPNERGDGLLVTVSVDSPSAERVSEILNKHHPVDLGREGKTWQGFNEEARESIFSGEQSSYREREPRSELDYGEGANTFLPGKAIEDYDRTTFNPPETERPAEDTWKIYESRFREHFNIHYAPAGKEWTKYRDAYRFGYETAQVAQFSNTTWQRASEYIRERWNTRMMGRPWDEYAEAVQDGWEAGHVM